MTPTEWAFLQNYYLDHSNACIHCAPVRFSPITFRLWESITAILDDPQGRGRSEAMPFEPRMMSAIAEVGRHVGAYEEDKGR